MDKAAERGREEIPTGTVEGTRDATDGVGVAAGLASGSSGALMFVFFCRENRLMNE